MLLLFGLKEMLLDSLIGVGLLMGSFVFEVVLVGSLAWEELLMGFFGLAGLWASNACLKQPTAEGKASASFLASTGIWASRESFAREGAGLKERTVLSLLCFSADSVSNV